MINIATLIILVVTIVVFISFLLTTHYLERGVSVLINCYYPIMVPRRYMLNIAILVRYQSSKHVFESAKSDSIYQCKLEKKLIIQIPQLSQIKMTMKNVREHFSCSEVRGAHVYNNLSYNKDYYAILTWDSTFTYWVCGNIIIDKFYQCKVKKNVDKLFAYQVTIFFRFSCFCELIIVRIGNHLVC